MEKIYSLVLTILCFGICAQVPSFFTYQGVIRDAAGQAYANRQITIKTSIIDSASATSTVQYAESHKVSTTDYGLYSITVGKGTVVEGNFANITWTGGNKFLKVEFDPLGGNNYILSGITQILSVPYALVSEKVKGNFLVSKVYAFGSIKDTLSSINDLNNIAINTSWIDGDPENIEVDVVNNPGNIKFLDHKGASISFPQILTNGDDQVQLSGIGLGLDFKAATPGIHPVRFRFKSLTSLQEKTRDCIIKLSVDTIVFKKYSTSYNGNFECFNSSDSLDLKTETKEGSSSIKKTNDGNFDLITSAGGPNFEFQYINFTFHINRVGTQILESSGNVFAGKFITANNINATLDPANGVIKTQFTYINNDNITRSCRGTYTPTK